MSVLSEFLYIILLPNFNVTFHMHMWMLPWKRSLLKMASSSIFPIVICPREVRIITPIWTNTREMYPEFHSTPIQIPNEK
jgi:hypothetical protein